MERRLLVVRHAKSDWHPEIASDHARPISPVGLGDAPRVAAAVAGKGWHPDHVACSDAVRTVQTWQAMAKALGTPSVATHPELYHAGLPALRQVAAGWDDRWRTVLALGHNPGWSELVHALSGVALELKTCNVVSLVTQADSWLEALEGAWQVEGWIRPRDP